MNENDSQFAWNVHTYLNGHIKFADTKAALLCGLTASLLYGFHEYESWKMALDGATTCGVLGMICFAVAFFCGFMAIWPSLYSTKTRAAKKTGQCKLDADTDEVPAEGYIFWKNIIAHPNANIFANRLSGLSQADEKNQVGQHCYDLAVIAERKYWWISIASAFFAIGVVALVLFVVMHGADELFNTSSVNSA